MPIINMIPAKSSMVLAAGTESIIVRKGIILYRNSWVPSDASSLYEYRIDDEKITDKSTVEIHVDLDYLNVAKAADIKPKTDSNNGYVILYATNIPVTNIICDYVIQKEASTTKLYMDGSDIDLSKAKDYKFDTLPEGFKVEYDPRTYIWSEISFYDENDEHRKRSDIQNEIEDKCNRLKEWAECLPNIN